MKWEALFQEVALTLQNPRAGARRILALHLTLGTGFSALLLMGVLNAALGYLGYLTSGMTDDPQLQALLGSPLQGAVLQVGIQSVMAFLLWQIGQRFGGQGGLSDAVALCAWLAVPMLGLQLVQILLLRLVPQVAGVVGFVAVGLNFWLLTLFACELHGFKSPFRVFMVIFGTSILLGLSLISLLISLGLFGDISGV